MTRGKLRHRRLLALVAVTGFLASCAPSTGSSSPAASGTSSPTASQGSPSAVTGEEFTVQIWADNWMAVYVNGSKVGEDSVAITTERSFNAETFTFTASYPFVVGIEAKDFMETDSGLEYIGTSRQQMGDGGVIAQVLDSSGTVVAATSDQATSFVVQRAPLNPTCEKDSDPDTTCQHESLALPADWSSPGFDDSGWVQATEWSAAQVGPKDGYDSISWAPSAALVWGTDLHIDNTVLLRLAVTG